MFDPLSILSIFAPVAVDVAKIATQKWMAPNSIKPLTVDDKLRLDQAEIDRLKVLAEIDKPAENVAGWVSDIRALMRPFIAISVTLAWCFKPDQIDSFLVSSIWFYLFGERTLRK